MEELSRWGEVNSGNGEGMMLCCWEGECSSGEKGVFERGNYLVD